MNSGIYIWKNIINDKVYIGATTNFRKRKQEHIRKSINGSHYEIHKAINEIGLDNFQFEILEYVNAPYLGEKEKFWIKKYNSINTGYNTLEGYNSISNNPNLDKIKANLSKKASKRKWIKRNGIQKSVYQEELEKYILEGWELGRIPFSKDHINRISKSVTGFKHTDEAKEKCKTFLGKSHSDKTKKEMSLSLMGRYSLKWYIEKYGERIGNEKYEIHQKNNSKSKIGKIWINKNGKTKQIDKIHYDKFISDGWKKGRK